MLVSLHSFHIFLDINSQYIWSTIYGLRLGAIQFFPARFWVVYVLGKFCVDTSRLYRLGVPPAPLLFSRYSSSLLDREIKKFEVSIEHNEAVQHRAYINKYRNGCDCKPKWYWIISLIDSWFSHSQAQCLVFARLNKKTLIRIGCSSPRWWSLDVHFFCPYLW